MRWMCLLAVVVLAGCGDAATDAPATGGKVPVGSIVDMPQWQLGDWWSVSDNMGRVYSIVVAGDMSGEWLVLSNDLSVALADWNFDISYLGNVRKSDLAGQQGNDRPKYFDWPLQDNKTWTTTWDGTSRTLAVDQQADGTFLISGTDNGELAVEYVYSPATKWLKRLAFYNVTGGGELQYGWEATGSGDSFSGTVYRYTGVEAVLSVAQQGPGNPQATFAIDEGVSELLITWTADCAGFGYMAAGVQPPNDDGSVRPTPPTPPPIESGETYGFAGQCPAIDGPGQEHVPQPHAGMWRMDGAVASSQSGFEMTATARTYEAFTPR